MVRAMANATARVWSFGRRALRRRSGGHVEPLGAVRCIRTGYFPEDLDYIDPEAPLLAERLGMRWRYMDDPTLQSPVLERNNVGMGMLVLNRPQGLDLPSVNTLYTRLRNLEVNSFKRFVGFTAFEPGPFCSGLDPRELLLAATSASQRSGSLPRFSRALLWNSQELAHLIADFRKPIVSQISGAAADHGAALGSLGFFAGAHEESEVSVDACFAGLTPAGGLCYVLARLDWHLGEYLALTGLPLRGTDLVYSGMVRHWMSPDALPFLELTAEKQLDVSEADGRTLLDEHSLCLPDVPRDESGKPSLEGILGVAPLVRRCFGKKSVPHIMGALRDIAAKGGARGDREFATLCLDRMERASPMALHATLRLIREARLDIQQEAKMSAMQEVRPLPGVHGESGALAKVLRLELRVLQRMLAEEDAIIGLHARCLGRELRAGDWSRKNANDVLSEEVDDMLSERSDRLGDMADFRVAPRSEFSLSTHPLLRRYHPDYDPHTGLDHDPAWAAQEAARWSPELFAEERRQAIEDLLGDEDPALYGLSRWTRVEPNPGTAGSPR